MVARAVAVTGAAGRLAPLALCAAVGAHLGRSSSPATVRRLLVMAAAAAHRHEVFLSLPMWEVVALQDLPVASDLAELPEADVAWLPEQVSRVLAEAALGGPFVVWSDGVELVVDYLTLDVLEEVPAALEDLMDVLAGLGRPPVRVVRIFNGSRPAASQSWRPGDGSFGRLLDEPDLWAPGVRDRLLAVADSAVAGVRRDVASAEEAVCSVTATAPQVAS